MASSILDFIASLPSPQDRLQTLLSILSSIPQGGGGSVPTEVPAGAPAPVGTYTPPTLSPKLQAVEGAGAETGVPTPPPPELQGTPYYGTGETAYPYIVYDQPYSGNPANLVTRHGLTLQRGPMRSLVDLFTGGGETDILPGLRELNKVTPGSFRTYNQQVNAAATNPYAADPGYSYHQQGLAIDFGWANQYDALIRALGQSGWNQFDRGYEPWHWSYGVTG